MTKPLIPPTQKKKKEAVEATDLIRKVGSTIDTAFINLVTSAIEFREYALKYPLALFSKCRLLAITDLLCGYADTEILARCPKDFQTLAHIAEIRSSPLYPILTERARAEIPKLQNLNTMEEVVDHTEGLMAREIVGMGLGSVIGRDRMQVARDIVDRRSAKAGRLDRLVVDKTEHLPPAVEAAMIETLKTLQSLAAPPSTVSASVMNVPLLSPLSEVEDAEYVNSDS